MARLAGLAPEKGLERFAAAYHQTDCIYDAGQLKKPECGGTFRCSACKHTYGWCVGHDNGPHCHPSDDDGTVFPLGGPCTRCDRCCEVIAAERKRKPSPRPFCYVYKQGMSGIYHKTGANGLPACGTRVDTAALEHCEDSPAGYDPCNRCFRNGGRAA